MNGVIHRHILIGEALSRRNLFAILGILLCVYFSYHVVQGQRSLMSLMTINNKIETQTQLHAELVQERARVESKVKMMRPGTLDRDLLEERIHQVLGYTQKDDYVISGH